MTPHAPEPLHGQHAVVTGGGRGIGAAIAEELARLGANLTLIGRTLATLTARRDELLLIYEREIATVAADVADLAGIERAFAAARAALGPPAILINNAGAAHSAPFRRTSSSDWQRMLDVNLTGPALCIQQVLEDMIAASYGRVVSIASTAGLKGYTYVAAYTAAKHGLVGLTRALALELASTGITVNAVCPGFTDTDLLTASVQNIVSRTGRSEREARAELARFNPQGRLIEPWEVARVAGWLCLPESSSITGQAIVVAGGEVM
jgi:NAD(P)-dependent dehydrogenase (short-subunit alcohol dehydrogenase family)